MIEATSEKPILFLQRHGQSENNAAKVFTCKRLDPNLTAHGRRQAADLVAFYRDAGVGRVVSSTSRRAAQTAEIIATGLGVPHEQDPDLVEVDVGDLEGKAEDDPANMTWFLDRMTRWILHREEIPFPGGESLTAVHARLDRARQRYLDKPTDQPTLLVAHCALIAVWLGRDGVVEAIDDVILPNAAVAGYFSFPRQWRRVR